ncbi:MAG: sensor histidine kinase [Hoeflea sp.]|uniref:sensor histidine kinase n=1 Tax=Hoeflea sp. TaxID=1940281 RepID=UPI0032EE09C2
MNPEPGSTASYSLRRRLTFAMMTGFLLILSILAVALWNYAVAAANRSFDLLLEGSAITILGRVSSNANGITVDFPPAALEMLGLAEDDRVFYRIFTAEGETLTGEADLPGPEVDITNDETQYFDARYSGTLVRFVRQRKIVAIDDQTLPVLVQVGQTRIARDVHRNALFLRGMMVLGVLAVAGIFFARMSINLALKPLSGIVTDIESRDPSDLRELKASPPREIASLIAAINGFMRRLDASKDNAQNFIADVAHQIRTSLSALNGQLELASEPGKPEELQRRIGSAGLQAKKTIALTNQLLAHAMVIHRADNQSKSAVDLVDLVTTAIENHVKQRASTGIEFEFVRKDALNNPVILGDAVSLQEALRNLISNVEAHAGDRPCLRFTIERSGTGNRVFLIVEDDGPGIPHGQRANALDRFSSFGNSLGSGLGLAIVKAVMDAHDGTVTLGDGANGGLRVELSFPC